MTLAETHRASSGETIDVAGLPDAAFGPKSLIWWGSFGFMLLEGSGFLVACGAYLYLASQSPAWPPRGDRPPDLSWSGLFTLALLASMVPNLWLRRRVERREPVSARWGVLAMTVIGLALTAVRAVELAHLNVRWSWDAYGSAVWLLMVLHTSHLLTDLGDTGVQAAWLFTHEIGDQQFSDVHDNCDYWTFVVLAWVPIYALVYFAPRLL